MIPKGKWNEALASETEYVCFAHQNVQNKQKTHIYNQDYGQIR
jgi:hypothetical protein